MICLTDGRTDGQIDMRHPAANERTANGMTFTLGRFDRRVAIFLFFPFVSRIGPRKAANRESKGCESRVERRRRFTSHD